MNFEKLAVLEKKRTFLVFSFVVIKTKLLEIDVEKGFYIPEHKYTGGTPIEVSPKIAFAIELRKARGNRTQKDVAKDAGMTYQQYQRLENPKKTNPTLEMLYRLQCVFKRPFLAL